VTTDNIVVIKSNCNCVLSIVINSFNNYLSFSGPIGTTDVTNVVTS
jgi:hypothetical protein